MLCFHFLKNTFNFLRFLLWPICYLEMWFFISTYFGIFQLFFFYWASLVAQMVKNLPPVQEIQVWPLHQENPLEKGMATLFSILAWKIPWTEEPSGLQFMESQRIGHDWVTLLLLFTFLHWRRKWQPTPVFLPGESQGRGSLKGCHLWGRTELDTTEAT